MVSRIAGPYGRLDRQHRAQIVVIHRHLFKLLLSQLLKWSRIKFKFLFKLILSLFKCQI